MNKKKLLELSGANKIIACFGKSTVENFSSSYILSKDIGKGLVSEGYAIIHGGYSGGLMEAVSLGAQEAIQKNKLSSLRDLGVPMVDLDNDWKRTDRTYFVKTCKTLSERLDILINMADAYLILPEGGFGTMLELTYAIHQNELDKKVQKPIYVMAERWKVITDMMIQNLEISDRVNPVKYVSTIHNLLNLLK